MADTGSSDPLVEALRAAVFGEPGAVAVDQPSVLWHFDWATDERPCPDSVVWSHRAGCYDVIVEVVGSPPELEVRTDGGTKRREPWPDDPAEREALLRRLIDDLAGWMRDDIARFETENGGYLPGTEPGVGR